LVKYTGFGGCFSGGWIFLRIEVFMAKDKKLLKADIEKIVKILKKNDISFDYACSCPECGAMLLINVDKRMVKSYTHLSDEVLRIIEDGG